MTNPKSFKQKSGFRITKSTRSKFPLICFSKLLHKNSEISSRVDPYNSPPPDLFMRQRGFWRMKAAAVAPSQGYEVTAFRELIMEPKERNGVA